MATLYVENVPDDLYEALRKRVREHRKAIASEVMSLLEENIVTADEHKARQQFLCRAPSALCQSLLSQRGNAARGPLAVNTVVIDASWRRNGSFPVQGMPQFQRQDRFYLHG